MRDQEGNKVGGYKDGETKRKILKGLSRRPPTGKERKKERKKERNKERNKSMVAARGTGGKNGPGE